MGKDRTRASDAGASALAEWRRTLRRAHHRRSITIGFVVAAVGLVVLGLGQGDSRWVAVAAIAAMAAWWARPDPDPDRWRRGAEGETATAVVLARLSRRWVVLHDLAVPGSLANIDHLVIGPTGVWVIDTKATRALLRVRRGGVWAGDHAIDTSSVAWQAEVVSGRLAVHAAPLVAVHGDGLRRRGKRSGGVLVVPAGRLIRRLRRGPRRFNWIEVAALARHAAEVLPPR